MPINSVLSIPSYGYKLSKKVHLIGIVGHAGTGKDSIAEYLTKSITADVYTHAFAWFLKAAAAEATGILFDNFHALEKKELKHPFWGVSPREFAQYIGTEMFRALSEDFWIQRMIGHIDDHLAMPAGWGSYEEGDVIIIPDVRFTNEVQFIQANGGKVIQLTRPGKSGAVGISGHASERGIDFSQVEPLYHISNHGTLEELYLEVDKFIDTQLAHLMMEF